MQFVKRVLSRFVDLLDDNMASSIAMANDNRAQCFYAATRHESSLIIVAPAKVSKSCKYKNKFSLDNTR